MGDTVKTRARLHIYSLTVTGHGEHCARQKHMTAAYTEYLYRDKL
jgi:hypothetical protein